MAGKKTFDHYVTSLPSTIIEDDHYYVRTSFTTAEYYIGGPGNTAILIGPTLVGSFNDVKNEIPSGIINGVNTVFNTLFTFVPGSLEVFSNGLLQKEVDEFSVIGPTTIALTFSPKVGEIISVNYKKV